MADLVVGISDLKVSSNPADSMITYALGSCIAVAVYAPAAKVGGLLHYMLPTRPSMPPGQGYAGHVCDTGDPAALQVLLLQDGADKKRWS